MVEETENFTDYPNYFVSTPIDNNTPYSEIIAMPLHLPGIDAPKIIPDLPDAWSIGQDGAIIDPKLTNPLAYYIYQDTPSNFNLIITKEDLQELKNL